MTCPTPSAPQNASHAFRRCEKPALTLFYWPGHDPIAICPDHHAWLIQVAAAMGLYVPTAQAPSGSTCTQLVTDPSPPSESTPS